MAVCRIIPMSNPGVSRAHAFRSYGVALKFPARSRSGVRSDDGMVVFAMPAAAVRIDDWGSSCLLWAPRGGPAPGGSVDRASSEERLRHCRLALLNGVAEGFLLGEDDAALERSGLLSLRVITSGEAYWAKWGRTRRASTGENAAASISAARF